MQILVAIVERREVELQRAEPVLGTEFERIDRFRLERVIDRADRERRVDAARFVAARVGQVNEVVRRNLVIQNRSPGHPAETDRPFLERLHASGPLVEIACRSIVQRFLEGVRANQGIERATAGKLARQAIAKQGCARPREFLVVVVAQAEREFHLVVELEVALAEDAVAVENALIGIAAEER